MPDASPTKWHRAHVTWFFEQFLLRPFAPDYKPFDERFAYLFNSYYVAAGPRQARPQRGLITRPDAAEVADYRAHVDAAVGALIAIGANDLATLIPIIEIGLNHEQQHQELLLTDILHAFSFNETHPAYDPDWQWPQAAREGPAARRADRRHPHDRSRRYRVLLRQRTAGASGPVAAGAAGAVARDQRRVARIHGRRRLHDADAVAVGRLGHGRSAKAGTRPAIGARSTAPGMR